MGKFYTFLLGVVAGFGLYHLSANFYVIHADDGLHWTPKTAARLENPYVDIREFGVDDFRKRPVLVAAIAASDDEPLKQAALDGAVGEGVGGLLQGLGELIPPAK